MSKEKIAFIPKQYFAVVAVLLAIMMSVLDGTIMNIALPTLAHDFDVTLISASRHARKPLNDFFMFFPPDGILTAMH